MIKTIGQIIKELRKERNLTQEELAFAINVTAQAVSKWENETGLPDISQIIPLSTFFNVPTDVLFGIYGTTSDKEVEDIIDESIKKITLRKKEDLYESFLILKKGLDKYPSNLKLLQSLIESCCGLGYKENDCYDEEHKDEIYEEAKIISNVILKYSNNIQNILRTKYIMILLHSCNKNFEEAVKLAQSFPARADMTSYRMCAYINHVGKEYMAEKRNLNWDILMHIEGLLDDYMNLGYSYELSGDYVNALRMYNAMFDLIKYTFKEDEVIPSLHIRDLGDPYVNKARCYVKLGNIEGAICTLKEMVEYDNNIRCNKEFIEKQNKDLCHKLNNPFLKYVDLNWYAYRNYGNLKNELQEKLGFFEELKGNAKFDGLIESVNNLN